MRRKTRTVTIGGVSIGSAHPVAIQSMTNTHTANVEATKRQLELLEKAGCEICRVTLNDSEAIGAIGALKASTKMPLVGDIHFDYRPSSRRRRRRGFPCASV
jgi:(E)-4-hydroxy-3-methylbut-2-enyl-diphosphate synthase